MKLQEVLVLLVLISIKVRLSTDGKAKYYKYLSLLAGTYAQDQAACR